MKLIEKIKKQSHATILGFLDKIQGNTSIYSNETNQFEHHVAKNGKNIILIAPNDKEAVLLLIDVVKPGTVELADEERFNDEDPLYFCENTTRISPIWLLTCAARHLLKSCDRAGIKEVSVGCVFLSNSLFVNYDEMADIWEDMGVCVYHNLKAINSFHFELNKDDSLKGSLLYHIPMRDIDRLFPPMPTSPPNHYSYIKNAEIEQLEERNVKDKEETTDTFSCEGLRAEILPPIKNPLKELNMLVGCTEIKKHIHDLTMLSQFNERLKAIDSKAQIHKFPLHSLFLGNPGTGKTTVCRIYGSLLKEAGVLSKGHVVVCNRGTFVGNLFGDEESSVSMAIRQARGGVLMIEEAYLLNSNHHADPGKLVLPLLMDVLADENKRDIAIVLCGYKKPMEQLLELNPGLVSRFPNKFLFPDFTLHELLEITRRRVTNYHYYFTKGAWNAYSSMINIMFNDRDPNSWANAREVSRILDFIYLQHARRCIIKDIHELRKLHCLTISDTKISGNGRKKHKIGFF